MSMQIEKELVRYQDDSFTKELNIICDVIPQVRGIANQVHKIVKVQLGYHLYTEDDAKVASVTMKTLADYSGHRR